MTEEEQRLMERARARDREAFSELYARHRGGVERLARARMETRADIDDLIGQTWLEAWTRVHRLDPGRGDFGAWVRGIARYNYLDALNPRHRTASLDELQERDSGEIDRIASSVQSPEERVVLAERMGRVLAAIPELTQRQRKALVMQIQGLSNREIGRALGLRELGLNDLLHRARTNLRQRAGEERQQRRSTAQYATPAEARVRVRELLTEDPTRTGRQIGRALGVSEDWALLLMREVSGPATRRPGEYWERHRPPREGANHQARGATAAGREAAR